MGREMGGKYPFFTVPVSLVFPEDLPFGFLWKTLASNPLENGGNAKCPEVSGTPGTSEACTAGDVHVLQAYGIPLRRVVMSFGSSCSLEAKLRIVMTATATFLRSTLPANLGGDPVRPMDPRRETWSTVDAAADDSSFGPSSTDAVGMIAEVLITKLLLDGVLGESVVVTPERSSLGVSPRTSAVLNVPSGEAGAWSWDVMQNGHRRRGGGGGTVRERKDRHGGGPVQFWAPTPAAGARVPEGEGEEEEEEEEQ